MSTTKLLNLSISISWSSHIREVFAQRMTALVMCHHYMTLIKMVVCEPPRLLIYKHILVTISSSGHCG